MLKVLKLEKLLEFKRRWNDDESKLRATLLERTLRDAAGADD